MRVTCPDCGGARKVAGTVPGVPAVVCVKLTPCQTCWPREAASRLKFWDDGTAGMIEVEMV